MEKLSNSVIIIGADHHNTLAVLRCLGKNKADITLLIHSSQISTSKPYIIKSRYAKKYYTCRENENELLIFLKKLKREEKVILFPCSDFAAYVLDKNYSELSANYIIPGFKNSPGKIVYLMDKWNQWEFARQNGIKMAKTWKIELSKDIAPINDIVIPCIIKPEISAFGSKSDIHICECEKDLYEAIDSFKEKKYECAIVQEFINKQYEVCAYGCLVDKTSNGVFSFGGVIKKEREWPPRGGGSLTYATFINDARVLEHVNQVLEILYNQGYRGQYDVEFFVCSNNIYLNEINFRHSGNGYGLIKYGVMAPYIWCLSATNHNVTDYKTTVAPGKHHMDEFRDLLYHRKNGLSFFLWIVEFASTKAHSVFDLSDLGSTISYYGGVLSLLVKKLSKRVKTHG